MDRAFDVVVVGGGAAGLAGAVGLARARRSVLVVDDGQPRNAPAAHVHNYLAREGASPADLLATGRAEVIRYGGKIIAGRVTTASRHGDAFLARLTSGEVISARRLLVATGLVDELPDVPGLAQRWGRDVLLLLNGSAPPDPDAAERLAARGVSTVDGSVVEVVAGETLTGVRLATGEIVPLDAVVVAPRFTARADPLAELGLTPVEVEIGGHVVGTPDPGRPDRVNRSAGGLGGRKCSVHARPGHHGRRHRPQRRGGHQRRPGRGGHPDRGERPSTRSILVHKW